MKPKRNNQYVCPLGKSIATVPSKSTYDRGSKSTVSGRYCRNNCSEYKLNKCPKFNVK